MTVEIAKEFPAMPGAVELVRSLYDAAEKLNLKIAVNSSSLKENVDASVRRLGIEKYLSAVVCQNDVEEVKPNPSIFLLASEQMNIRPENCIVIEDSTFGIAAAKTAGMYCIGFQSMGHRPDEYGQADRVIHSLTELDPILVFAQELVPGKVGMIAGLFFVFAFGIAGIVLALLGKVADLYGIAFVYKICSYLPLLGLATVFCRI